MVVNTNLLSRPKLSIAIEILSDVDVGFALEILNDNSPRVAELRRRVWVSSRSEKAGAVEEDSDVRTDQNEFPSSSFPGLASAVVLDLVFLLGLTTSSSLDASSRT